jgi:MerR family transcriptional regulator/heat shock protein HspR
VSASDLPQRIDHDAPVFVISVAARLRLIQRLSQDEGINLEGIRRILHMQDEIDELRARADQLTALLAAVQESSGSRVFTADPIGGVHLGRRGRRTPLALPGRPLP